LRLFRDERQGRVAVEELRAAIESATSWDELPTVTSPRLATIQVLPDRGQENRTAVSPGGPAVRGLPLGKSEVVAEEDDLRATSMSVSAGSRPRSDPAPELRRLLLLQPELLDAYASALVMPPRTNRTPGSIAEERALGGISVPEEQRIATGKQEQLLLHATSRNSFATIWHCGKAPLTAATWSSFAFNRDYAEAGRIRGEKPWPYLEGPTQSVRTFACRLSQELAMTQATPGVA